MHEGQNAASGSRNYRWQIATAKTGRTSMATQSRYANDRVDIEAPWTKSLITYGRPWASRSSARPLARPGQNPSHAAPRHYCGAGNISPCILFDHADGMARGDSPTLSESRQASSSCPACPIVISGGAPGAAPARATASSSGFPFICPGIQAYLPFMDEEYWSGKPNKQVKIYDPHEVGTAGGLTGARPAGGKCVPP